MYGLPSEASPWMELEAGDVRFPALGGIVSLSPDGKSLMTAPEQRSKQLFIWNTYTGQLLQTLHGSGSIIRGATFASDHTILAWDDGGTLTHWDFRRGTQQEWSPRDTADTGGWLALLRRLFSLPAGCQV